MLIPKMEDAVKKENNKFKQSFLDGGIVLYENK
jgi:hypothetical protein